MEKKEKTYFEQLQEQARTQEKQAGERGPELEVGPQRFTIIGGDSGVSTSGFEWSAVVMRHTNGFEYRLFYNLYWPLKEGELQPQLNVDAFNWIVGFDSAALAGYTEESFNKYFDGLAGRSYEINYTLTKAGKVVVDFKTLPILLDTLEETLEVDEIDFDME